MSKLKPCFVLAVSLFCVLVFAAPAFAWTHGQFFATTDACAGCHVAHAAQAPNLLKAGPTQTQFCFLCHGDGCSSAPYDVEDGYTRAVVGGGVYASTAGGFVNEFVDANSNNIVDSGELKTVTSRHNVWGFSTESGPVDGTDLAGDTIIPGGINTIAGSSGFVCASCHDPHGGGTVPIGGYVTGSSTSPNPRLLRRSFALSGGTADGCYMKFKMDTVGEFTYQGVSSGVYKVSEYHADYDFDGVLDTTKYGSSYWCGGCHDRFKSYLPDGSTGGLFGTMMKHPTFGHAALPSGADSSMASGTPLEKDDDPDNSYLPNRVGCLTCHRAHSTTATRAGWATSWPRDSSAPTATSNTSALLRMDNRGICYNCHGAAQYNCMNDTRTFNGIKCRNCHL
ncbi:MAG: cytochrome c3 family protein [Bacillota bacterium]